MKLSFASSYMSIHDFPTVEVPDFCLLTGPNGAGKSHLLQALLAGSIKADCAPSQSPQNQSEIRLFDWNTLVPQDTGMFSSEALRNERSNLANQFQVYIQQPNTIEPLRSFARNNRFAHNFLADPLQLVKLTEVEFRAIAGENADDKMSQLNVALDQSVGSLMSRFDINNQYMYRSIADAHGKSILLLSDEDFASTTIPGWGQVSVFQQSFARLFVAYRDLHLKNNIREFQASKGINVSFLTQEEFKKVNGPAPWDFVNQSLASANLDFKVNKPDLDAISRDRAGVLMQHIISTVLTDCLSALPVEMFDVLSSLLGRELE